MTDGRKLYRTIVGYALALVTTVEVGTQVACTRNQRIAPREGPTPAYCEVNDCAVHGRIVDEHGAPVAGATVEYAGQTTTSDAQGFWTFPPVREGMVAARAESSTTVTVTKDGRVVSQEYDGRSDGRFGPPPVNLQFPALPPPPPLPP